MKTILRGLTLAIAFGASLAGPGAQAQSVNVNFNGFTGGNPGPGEQVEDSLEGPAGGLGSSWNQFADEDSAGTLIDATGGATTIQFTTNFSEGRYNGTGPSLTMLRNALTDFNRSLERTLTITGLDPTGLFDIWLVGYRDSNSTRERIVGTWSTSNATASPDTQLIDNRPNSNRSTFVEGYNYVLFQGVVPNASGQIVFEGNGADRGEGFDDDHIVSRTNSKNPLA